EAPLGVFGAFSPVIVLVQVAVTGGALHRKESRWTADGPASVVGKAGNMDQVPALTDALLVTENEVELALKHESELFLVRMHVERRGLLIRLGHQSPFYVHLQSRLS